LREQVRAIYKELGEQDDKTVEIEDYRRKIKRAKMPKEADQEAIKQLKRLEQMHPDSAEATVSRTYLDWLVDLPWAKSSRDRFDIAGAKSVLEKDHYGLNKVKDRILEYLSVRKLNPKMKGPILCFVGPPGVGKTSLPASVRPLWANPSPGPSNASLSEFRWAEFAMRPKLGAIAGPTLAPCPAAFCRG
jgi:ATP-dependent Lon protease